MDMKHDEVKRIIPGARTAVLLIHGICGTPNHFVGGIPLMEWIPSDWSIYNLLLPGHGGTVEDFAKSSLKQWRCSARRAFCSLVNTHWCSHASSACSGGDQQCIAAGPGKAAPWIP